MSGPGRKGLLRKTRTIRARLITSFAALALLVALVVSATSILLSIQSVQEQVYRELESSVVLKVEAVDTWVDQLQFVLSTMLVELYEVQRAQSVLGESLGEDLYQINAARELRVRLNGMINNTQWFTEMFMVNRDGDVVLSTDRDIEGRSVAAMDYYQQGLEENFVSAPHMDPLVGGVSVVFVRPLKLGNFTYGILAARADLDALNAIMASGVTGETGVTHLVSPGNLLLTERDAAGAYIGEPRSIASPAVERVLAMVEVETGAEIGSEDPLEGPLSFPVGNDAYVNHNDTAVLGVYTWLPELSSVIISEVDRTEVLAGARTTSFVNGGVAVLAAGLAVLLGVFISRSISDPLVELAGTATAVAQGDLDLATAERELREVGRGSLDDDVGALAAAFRAMTAQVADLVEGLEARVNERTRGLQAVTEVSRATTSVLDLDELLPRVVSLVQERFDLYYVGLFLLDQIDEYAVLRAGTGEAGARMLVEGWRLRIDGGSMIGQCVVRGEEVINQDPAPGSGKSGDGADLPGTTSTVRFENPLLPNTRSELALPLRYGNRVIGAMTVQSERPVAFDETNIAVFQNMADQVAVAVQNARLFAETAEALERAQRVQARYQTQSWSTYLGSQAARGYEYRGGEVVPLALALGEDNSDAPGTLPHLGTGISIGPAGELRVPIVQGGQTLGVLGLQRSAAEGVPGDSPWTNADITLVEGLVEQMVLAAENQRLLDETQRREAAERLTREVTARMQEPIELEDVLRTAADEIRRAFQSDWVVVRLDPDLSTATQPNGQDQGDGHA